MKYVLVTGGVVSGLGKGVTASSTGVLLQARGLRVTSIKIGGCFGLLILRDGAAERRGWPMNTYRVRQRHMRGAWRLLANTSADITVTCMIIRTKHPCVCADPLIASIDRVRVALMAATHAVLCRSISEHRRRNDVALRARGGFRPQRWRRGAMRSSC